MNALTRKGLTSFFIFILFSIVLITLRPARDDWSHWSNLRKLDFAEINSWQAVISNSWCCSHETRNFFLTWLIQWPLTKLGSFTPYATYLVVMLLCFWIYKNSLQIFMRISGDRFFARIASSILVFSPFVVVVGFWLNNLFFLLPLATLLQFIRNLVTESRRFVLSSLMFVFTLFSGEATLGLLFLSSILAFALTNNRSRKIWLFCLFLFGVFSLLYYREKIAVGPELRSINFSESLITNYLKGFFNQFVSIILPLNRAYTYSDLNWLALLLVFVALLFLSFASNNVLRDAIEINVSNKEYNYRAFHYLIPIVAYLASLSPLLLGSVIGVRSGSDYRYHLVPYATLVFGAMFYLNLTLRRFYPILKISISVLCVFTILVTSLAFTNRVKQGNLDHQLWVKIESLNNFPPSILVTYNPHTPYVMPPYHSFAESDFQADWGVAGYIDWKTSKRPMVFKEISCSQDKCVAVNYYDVETVLDASIVKETIFIMANLDITAESMELNDFEVTSDFSRYKEYVERFPRIQN